MEMSLAMSVCENRVFLQALKYRRGGWPPEKNRYGPTLQIHQQHVTKASNNAIRTIGVAINKACICIHAVPVTHACIVDTDQDLRAHLRPA
uniref:Uncharacterized protein n=1 Tax=Oryza punctata TaxID=4537 RepID=A0A0E0KYT6_ORYPU